MNGEKGRALGIELWNARTKKLTVWKRRDSLSAEVETLNEALLEFQDYAAKRTGRVRKPATEEEWSAHIKENASVDLKKHARRALCAACSCVALIFAAHPLYTYWKGFSPFLAIGLCALAFLSLQDAASAWIEWRFVRRLNKIHDRDGGPED